MTQNKYNMGRKEGNSMFCPNCGKQNKNDAIFCVNCGSRLPKTTSTSDSINEIPEIRQETRQENKGVIEINTTKLKAQAGDGVKKAQDVVKRFAGNKRLVGGVAAGVVVVVLAIVGLSWFNSQPTTVDWTEGLQVELSGTNGNGWASLSYETEDDGSAVLTSNQSKVVDKYLDYMAKISALAVKYSPDLREYWDDGEFDASIDPYSNPSVFTTENVQNYEDEYLNQIEKLHAYSYTEIDDSELSEVKMALRSEAMYFMSCEISPYGVDLDNLKNGDVLQISCVTNPYIEGQINVKTAESVMEYTVEGLPELTIIDPISVVKIDSFQWNQDAKSYFPVVSIDEAALPSGVSVNDLELTANSSGYSIKYIADNDLYKLTSENPSASCGTNSCTITLSEDQMPREIDDLNYGSRNSEVYKQVAELIYQQVNPIIDTFGWTITDDETGEVHTIQSYELYNQNNSYDRQLGTNQTFEFVVHCTDGNDYKMFVESVPVYQMPDGTYSLSENISTILTGSLEHDKGVIR